LAKGASGEQAGGMPLAGELAARDKADRFGAPATRLYAGDGAAASAAPASIYFNPRLIADDNGRATIEFTMPLVESEYRLLIDALGNGRIGSLQQVIECKKQE
jgi:hypothetical protein